jgi:hypothetical protein
VEPLTCYPGSKQNAHLDIAEAMPGQIKIDKPLKTCENFTQAGILHPIQIIYLYKIIFGGIVFLY